MSRANKKILCCGDVRGELQQLLARVNAINKNHGPFDLLFCVGNFFGNKESEFEAFLNGEEEFPIPTYFIVSDDEQTSLIDALPDGGILGKNIFYLGRSGVRDIQGLKVGFLSGVHDADLYRSTEARPAQYQKHYTEADANVLLKLGREQYDAGIDLLLTSEWPRNFSNTLTTPPPRDLGDVRILGSPVVSEIALRLAPRYHFAAHQDFYYSLPPYANFLPRQLHVTRFYGLASLTNAQKMKSLYACNLTALSEMTKAQLQEHPANTVPCPYAIKPQLLHSDFSDPTILTEAAPPPKRHRSEMMGAGKGDKDEGFSRWGLAPPAGYVCNKCKVPGHWIQDCKAAPQDREAPAGYICRICNQPGHLIQNCPSASSNREEKKEHRDRDPPADYVCKICGDGGHWIQACPRKNDPSFAKRGPASGNDQQGVPPASYTCRICQTPGHWIQNCPQRPAAPAKGGQTRADCWFCLGTQGAETHLVVSVAEETYLALAKGGINKYNVLILPIHHIPSTAALSASALAEIQQYKSALRRCYEQQGLATIFHERFVPTKGQLHTHIQCMGVDQSIGQQVGSLLQQELSTLGLRAQPLESTLSQAVGRDHYVYFDLADGKELVGKVDAGARCVPHLLQMARQVVTRAMRKPELADWKRCQLDKSQETAMAEQFKAMFQPFDPF
eukprot:TRINITY_DN3127_c0_g1_i6.p1 TRINITY_DN3127_c0_g1~~TRINITY_DN3127_c0_g1_i6.p1  ORF type:complete len:673 (+),score=142.97 TRINITY_DN3127_c0_g1_i6:57-2075(+)